MEIQELNYADQFKLFSVNLILLSFHLTFYWCCSNIINKQWIANILDLMIVFDSTDHVCLLVEQTFRWIHINGISQWILVLDCSIIRLKRRSVEFVNSHQKNIINIFIFNSILFLLYSFYKIKWSSILSSKRSLTHWPYRTVPKQDEQNGTHMVDGSPSFKTTEVLSLSITVPCLKKIKKGLICEYSYNFCLNGFIGFAPSKCIIFQSGGICPSQL